MIGSVIVGMTMVSGAWGIVCWRVLVDACGQEDGDE